MYSRPENSSSRPSTSLLLALIALMTSPMPTVVGGQLVRIDVDLILLDEAADARDLGDAWHGGEPVAQIPVLEAAQLGQVVLPGLVNQRVLEDPADAGRVGADRRD